MLPRSQRLKKDEEIKRLFAKGRNIYDDWCGIKFVKNSLPFSRFLVIVGTKVSKKAVVRNRLRRQVQAILEKWFVKIQPGYDVAILARAPAIDKKLKEIEPHLVHSLERAKIL